MMRSLWVLTRVELLRLFRTREVHLFLLLPALFGVPLVAAVALVVSSWAGGSVSVALPPDLPADLQVQESLEADLVRVVVTDDPAAAYWSGEVDAAVVVWVAGDGVGAPAGTDFETRLVALGHEPRAREALQEGVRRANRKHVEERVLASGGAHLGDLFHLWWKTVPMERPPPAHDRFQALVLGYVAFLLGLVSYQVLPIAMVSDRLDGIAESFGATPVSRAVLLLSRLIALTLVELLALGLLLLSAWALLSSLADVPVPDAEGVARAIAALTLINALYLLPGVRARSAREALNLSSIVLLTTGGLLGGGLAGLPTWVPLAGVAAAPPGPEGWIAATTTALAAVAVVALAVRLTTSESLVAPGQTR
jgi:ABC-type Na+ efflux pump permease subunit